MLHGAGGMAQAVECLLIKCEALSSNSSTAKKPQKTKIFGTQNQGIL
jgi:hypothetical protein